MSRYMWRKYKQNSKKQARLDSSYREESRKVATHPSRKSEGLQGAKKMRAVNQPSSSATAFALNPDDETVAATPMECSRSESDVTTVDLPEVSDVQSRQDFETRWSHSNRYFERRFSRKTLVILEMFAIDFGLEKT
jgi:hypothetical protein